MDIDICDSCQLQNRYQTIICSKCGKPTRATQTLYIAHGDSTTRVCLKCAPQELPIQCTVCKTSKHPSAFTTRHRSAEAKKTGIMRCKACSEQCSACGRHMTNDSHFATNSSLCWKCYRQKRHCARCQKLKPHNDYEASVLHNHISNRRLLVCKACSALYYSPEDIRSYTCAGGHECGHLAFTYKKKLLDNVKRGHTSAKHLICVDCKERPQYKCSIAKCAFKAKQYEWEFDPTALRAAKSKNKTTF